MTLSATKLELVRSIASPLRRRIAAALDLAGDDKRQAGVNVALDECLAALAATGIWGEENRFLSSELWNLAGDLLEAGWLQARARNKPRGYAGDHELLRRILEQEICEHPLGRHFDAYFQAQAAPQAVRNRALLAAAWIEESVSAATGQCRVSIVGSGPASEVVIASSNLPAALRSRLHVTLLDLDGEALDGSRAQLTGLLPADQVATVQGNLFRLAQKPELANTLQSANLILCTGLFDYLDAKAAAEMLAEFWRRLVPGGVARVFNFAAHNPTRAYMEWFGNWYLIYRDQDALAALATAAGVPQDCATLGAEPLGVDLYLQMRKPAEAPIRPV